MCSLPAGCVCILPTRLPVKLPTEGKVKSSPPLAALLFTAEAVLLLARPSPPCRYDVISWHRRPSASRNPRTPCKPAEKEVASGPGKHVARGKPGTQPVGLKCGGKTSNNWACGERARPRLTLTHAHWERASDRSCSEGRIGNRQDLDLGLAN